MICIIILFLERLNPQTYKIRRFCLIGASKGGFIGFIRKNVLKMVAERGLVTSYLRALFGAIIQFGYRAQIVVIRKRMTRRFGVISTDEKEKQPDWVAFLFGCGEGT